jgi:hypothetical protein
MTNVDVTNDPVVETITSGNDVTVPSGEVWKVTVIGDMVQAGDLSRSPPDDQNYSEELVLTVNGVSVIASLGQAQGITFSAEALGQSQSQATTFPFDAVFKDGDTIGVNGGNLILTGFVVSTTYTP